MQSRITGQSPITLDKDKDSDLFSLFIRKAFQSVTRKKLIQTLKITNQNGLIFLTIWIILKFFFLNTISETLLFRVA